MGTLYGSGQEEDWVMILVMMIQLIPIAWPFIKIKT
jgi:hypothetical protein